MLEHVTLLLSMVYAVALTHLLSTANELLIAHRRLRVSGLYLTWLVIALFMVVINWLSLWGLVAVKRWTIAEVLIQFLMATVQYFTCSTFRISEARMDERIDLPAIMQERRRMIAGAFLALASIALFINWWDRNNISGLAPADWIGEDLSILPMVAAVMVAGWARPPWLQWAAAAVMLVLQAFFLVTYALPGA